MHSEFFLGAGLRLGRGTMGTRPPSGDNKQWPLSSYPGVWQELDTPCTCLGCFFNPTCPFYEDRSAQGHSHSVLQRPNPLRVPILSIKLIIVNIERILLVPPGGSLQNCSPRCSDTHPGLEGHFKQGLVSFINQSLGLIRGASNPSRLVQ